MDKNYTRLVQDFTDYRKRKVWPLIFLMKWFQWCA
jgi:hypothetical protein